MRHVTWMSAALLAGSLGACGERDEPVPAAPGEQERTAEAGDWEASIAGLRGLADEDFTLEGSSEADLTAINEALPDLVSVTWDEKSFDEESGATRFTKLTVIIASDPEFGITAEEAEIWGLNSDLVSARLRGERLDETGLAFNRLEAENVSYFGVAGAMNALFDKLAEEIEAESEYGEEFDFSLDTFESNTSQMVLSGVSLRPYEYVPVPDTFFGDVGIAQEDADALDEEEAEQRAMALNLVRIGQQVLAVSRSFSIEDAATYNTVVTFDMQQPGMSQTANIAWDFYGYEDVSGLDVGRAVIAGINQSQSMTVSDSSGELAEAGFEDGLGFEQVEKTAFVSYEGVKLDKLAGYFARGDFPRMDERDLLSLGTWNARDYSLTLNDGDLFEVDEINVDAKDFAWFVPEDFTVEMNGAEFGTQAVAEFALTFIPETAMDMGDQTDAPEAVDPDAPAAAEEGEDFMASLNQAVGMLDEHGLSTIPFDTRFTATWDEAGGDSAFAFDMTSEGFGEGLASLDVTLPGYEAIQAAVDSGAFETAFEDAWREAFVFRGARFFEEDNGGYDKLFGYANAIGKLYPDEGWGAMLGGMDPEQMRGFMANMIRSAKGAAAQQVPQASDWLESVAAYYQTSGGSLDIRVQPSVPITVEYIDSLDPETPPAEIVEDFGVTVTHTPE